MVRPRAFGRPALRLVPPVPPGERRSRGLSLVADEDCVRVESDIDPIYWLRLEAGAPQEVIVTDFTAGGRPEAELDEGIVRAVEALRPGRISRLVFRDLVPQGAQSPLYRMKVVEAFDRTKRLAAAVAEAEGLTVSSAAMETQQGKLHAVIRLAV